MDNPRPAPIPVYLAVAGTRVDGVLSAQRAPRRPGDGWVWRLVWRVDGKQKQRGLGRIAEDQVMAAATRVWREEVGPGGAVGTRVRAGAVVSNVDAGRDTAGVRTREDREHRSSRTLTVPSPDATIEDLTRAFLAWHEARPPRARKKPRTRQEYANRCGCLVDGIGEVRVSEIDDDTCEQLVELLLSPAFRAKREARFDAARPPQQTSGPRANGRGYSASRTNQVIDMLAMVLRWGRKRGWPCADVDARAAKIQGMTDEDRVYRHHTPEDEEVQALLDDLTEGSAVRRAMLLMWRCGVRASEADALRWCDLERTPRGTFLAVGTNPEGEGHRKSRARPTRRVAVEAEVARLLEAERPAGDGVRPMLTKARWSTRIVDCQRRRGIPRERQFTPHGLRRRFCSNLLDAGCPIGLYVDQAGHSPRVALSVYYRATDRRRQALQVEVAGMTSGVDLSAVIAELGLTPREAELRLRAFGPAKRVSSRVGN